MANTFRFIDICAGIGGLRIPFDELGGTCVFTSEIDSSAISTYLSNFGGDLEDIDRDITKVGENSPDSVPDHDLLLAGFPCQPFSHAGKRKGFADTRGTIFFSIANIVKAKRPKVVLLENVKGLRNHDDGNTLQRILEVLRNPSDGLEYVVPEPKILNARDFGLAQNRQRIFIIAIRKDLALSEQFEWPQPTFDRDSLLVKNFLETPASESLTISDRLWAGHKARKARNVAAGKGFGFQLFDETSRYVSTISARYYKDGSEALIRQKDANPRKLSPREVARLQGFPESFILSISKQNAYKQLGNAVPVSVIRALAKNLEKYLVSR